MSVYLVDGKNNQLHELGSIEENKLKYLGHFMRGLKYKILKLIT